MLHRLFFTEENNLPNTAVCSVNNGTFVRGILRGSRKSLNRGVQIIVGGVKIVKGRRVLLGAKITGSRVIHEVQLCKHCVVSLFAGEEE